MIHQLVAEDLKRDEGFRDHAYDDATGEPVVKGSTVYGYVTTGYGFCLDKDRGTPLPRHIALAWLEWEINRRWEQLAAEIPWVEDLPEDCQRALGSMIFQIGVSGVLGFKKMLAALEAGEREKAAKEAINSLWAAQTPERAARVAALIRGRV